jgi:hypothetical protein
MKKTLLIITLVTASVTIFSCKKETPLPEQLNAETSKVDIDNCVGTEVVLKAGQTIDAGTIEVTNDADYIYVTYTTANGYLLTQTHLFAGNCALVPVNNNGNPMPGQFPYKTVHNYATSYTYQIPVSTIGLGNCGCIAAHAVVVKLGANGQVIEQQTGWGNGVRINPNGGNWGMKFDFCTCTFTP